MPSSVLGQPAAVSRGSIASFAQKSARGKRVNCRSIGKQVNAAAATEGPIILDGQVLHSLTPARLEIVQSMDDFAAEQVLPLLKPVDKCWQPQDFLPDPESPNFLDAVHDLRERTKNVPDEYFVVLIGDMTKKLSQPIWLC